MSHLDLSVGERLELDGIAYAVERRTSTGIQLVGIGDGIPKVVTDSDLRDAFFEGRLSRHLPPRHASPIRALNPPPQDFTAVPERHRATAIARCLFVETLRTEYGTISLGDPQLAEAVDRLRSYPGMPKRLSLRTARRLIANFRKSPGPLNKGDLLANVPGRGGPRERRVDGTVRLFIDELLNEHWLKPEPDHLQAIYHDVVARIGRENRLRDQSESGRSETKPLRIPSRATFYRIVEEYDDEERIEKQEGSRAARNAYRPVLFAEEARVPMGVLEIDHTPVDVIVVDVNDLVIGRPTLTIAIDRRTRMIVGFVLHWEGESYAAIMMALRHAIKPKGYVKQAFGGAIVNEWPCWGLPSVIVIDNGRANHSANLDAACASLGNIGIDYTESRRPQHKAKVERLFATLNKYLFHELPGVSLKRAPDSDYEPSKSARIQLQALNEALHRIIVDFYNVKFHSGLKDIPLEAWRAGVAKTKLRSPSHVRDLDVLSSGSETRKLGVKGINIFGLRYNSLELEYLRVESKGDRDVVVRYDPTDITSIQIYDPVRERYLTVPCLEEEAHGLSVWRWNALRSSRVEKKKRSDRSGIWESRRATTDKLIAQAKKRGNRSKGKRHAVRHHEPAMTPDELARRDPVDLLQRPPADRPRAKKRGTTPVDYRNIPELPTSTNESVGVIPDLPNFDNQESLSAIESEKTALSATFENDSVEAKSARASPQHGGASTAEGSDADFEAFLAKKLFVARR